MSAQGTTRINTASIGTPYPIAKLGWILIHHRWISPMQLQEALRQQLCTQQPAQKLGELLMARSLISEQQLQMALREQYWRRQGYWIID